MQRFSVSSLLIIFLLFASNGLVYSQTQEELSPKDKAEVFQKVWNLINDRYYDSNLNGVDWLGVKKRYEPQILKAKDDRKFYSTIKKMVAEMNDAHTRFLTPRESLEFKKLQGTTTGIVLEKIGEQSVIVAVVPNSSADRIGLKPGMVVKEINGKSIEKRFAKTQKEIGSSSSERVSEFLTYRKMLSGEPGTFITLEVVDKKGKEFKATLLQEVVTLKPRATPQILPSGIGYISVNSFKRPISARFRQALLQVKDTPGLIIDLRFNGGGDLNETLRMASFLLNERRSFGKVIRRSRNLRNFSRKISVGRRGNQIYSAPVIVLTNKFSASGSELFASGLQEVGRVKVVGRQTCGCLLGISKRHKLKGGGELHVSDTGFLSSQGKIYEKNGITPDKIVELKIEDLRSGFDRGIAEAENLLNQKMAKK